MEKEPSLIDFSSSPLKNEGKRIETGSEYIENFKHDKKIINQELSTNYKYRIATFLEKMADQPVKTKDFYSSQRRLN